MTTGNGNTVRSLNPDGTYTVLAGSGLRGFVNGPAATARFDFPAGVAYWNGRLFVADVNNDAIRVIDFATPAATGSWGRVKRLYR